MNIERLNELLAAVGSDADCGEAALGEASLQEAFSVIGFMQDEAQGETLAPALRDRLDTVRIYTARRAISFGACFILFSALTKSHQSIGGAAAVALDEPAGKYITEELGKEKHRAVLRGADSEKMPDMLRGMAFNGFTRVRFYKSHSPFFEVPLCDLVPLGDVPEGKEVRYAMLTFLQEVRRGVKIGELKDAEKAMYDALNQARFFLPGKIIKEDENGQKTMSHPCVMLKDAPEKRGMLPVFTARTKLINAPANKKLREQDPTFGMTEIDYRNLIRACERNAPHIGGVLIDGGDISLAVSTELLKIHLNL